MCREENQHGGTAIYAKKGIQGKKCTEDTNLFTIGVCECRYEFRINSARLVILSVYRTCSGDIEEFLEII